MENEYGNVQAAYGADGALYVKWAAETAVGLNTSVPWVMCAQEDAPDPIVSIYLITICIARGAVTRDRGHCITVVYANALDDDTLDAADKHLQWVLL